MENSEGSIDALHVSQFVIIFLTHAKIIYIIFYIKTAIKSTERTFFLVFITVFIPHFAKTMEFLMCFENSLQKFTETYFAATGAWYFKGSVVFVYQCER